MDFNRIDKLLKYALAVAGENDEFQDRGLGPIHLIKYVYLADLAWAQHHEGETYTGIEWRFHKFGPWSFGLFERIDDALSAGGARKITLQHPRYEDDFSRWSLKDEELLRDLEGEIPLLVGMAIKSAVRTFGSDTGALLNHVYLTEPMLRAAPGEILNLSPRARKKEQEEQSAEVPLERTVQVSKKEKEARRKRLMDLKTLVRSRLDEKKRHSNLVPPDPPPRHDDVYLEGQAWLDSEAGDPLEEKEYKARFAEDIWKSQARYDPELS